MFTPYCTLDAAEYRCLASIPTKLAAPKGALNKFLQLKQRNGSKPNVAYPFQHCSVQFNSRLFSIGFFVCMSTYISESMVSKAFKFGYIMFHYCMDTMLALEVSHAHFRLHKSMNLYVYWKINIVLSSNLFLCFFFFRSNDNIDVPYVNLNHFKQFHEAEMNHFNQQKKQLPYCICSSFNKAVNRY